MCWGSPITPIFRDLRIQGPRCWRAILGEGARLCEETWAPTNLEGDRTGCRHAPDGSVTTPKSFKAAYRSYCAGGWVGLAVPEAFGGQGLPSVLNTAMQEYASSANLALAMYPGLTQGAIAALLVHGSREQKETYVPRLASGEWSGHDEPHRTPLRHRSRPDPHPCNPQWRRLLCPERHQDLHLLGGA